MGLDSNKDLYEILGLDPSAPDSQVERAYRFVKGIYDDPALGAQLGSAPAEVARLRQRIDLAYRVLSDPAQRRAYDESRSAASAATPVFPPRQEAPHLNRRVRRERERAAAVIAAAAASTPRPAPPAGPKRSIVPPPGPYNGKVLQAYRIARGVSLEEIAAETKIRTHYLEKIEADSFDAFPAVLYLKGYLHAYCRVLGLDAVRVVNSYLSRVSLEPPPLRLPSFR